MNENPEIKTLTKEEVEKEIVYILDQVALLGANDSEIPTLYELINGLKSGKYSSQHALSEAQKILNRKEDYH